MIDMLPVTYLVHPNIAFRLDLKNMQELKEDNKKVNKDVRFEQSACFDIQDAALLKGDFIICYAFVNAITSCNVCKNIDFLLTICSANVI